ncbi:MAG TPA: aminoacyl-tRNA hydrolase [Candidatus Gallacutalibacter stercoravium]|nr:aminoacyl-tRNA hydrolase [Candidatus Gallacutalibacter stercoravium]
MFSLFHKKMSAAPLGPVEYLIVGLGNPGKQYDGTRHNAGFAAIDELASRCGATITKLRFKALCGDALVGGKHVLLVKPQTFMNLSGQAVQQAMAFYKLPPERVIVLFDDISLPPGRLRIRKKGSDGGHNGVKNIIYLTGKDTFPRVKLGVGAKPRPDYNLADWVLSHFSQEEHTQLQQAINNACGAVELMVQGKTEEAMNRYNS